jgi:hypothetical protein
MRNFSGLVEQDLERKDIRIGTGLVKSFFKRYK